MLNKDDAVQIDNVNSEGEDENIDQAQFAKEKVWHSIPQQADRLSKFLFKNGFKRGKLSKPLFSKSQRNELLIIQAYIDDVILGAIF